MGNSYLIEVPGISLKPFLAKNFPPNISPIKHTFPPYYSLSKSSSFLALLPELELTGK